MDDDDKRIPLALALLAAAVGLTWATRTSSHVEIAQRMALIRKSEPSIGILVACGRELFGIRPDRSITCGSPPDRHHSSRCRSRDLTTPHTTLIGLHDKQNQRASSQILLLRRAWRLVSPAAPP